MNNEFTKWFIMCVQNKYVDFKGRARRKEYWMFVLVYIILALIIGIIESILGIHFLSPILYLALLLPSIAVGIRRLHDIGKSGWWILVALIPLIGTLYLLYLMIKDSQPGANQWGENPKN